MTRGLRQQTGRMSVAKKFSESSVLSSSRADERAWLVPAGLLLCLLLGGCATRVSTLEITDVQQLEWSKLRAIGDDVASRFGFVSAASEIVGSGSLVGEGEEAWFVVGDYSNRERGLGDIGGGRSDVWFSIYFRPESRDAKISVVAYFNTDRTEYLKALEEALAAAVRNEFSSRAAEWQANVVRTLPP